jgi:membrane-associated protease RseP (regulator of RpoE activity)
MSESVQTIPPFVQPREAPSVRRAASPSTREWLVHSSLFVLTFITTTIAGILLSAPADLPVSEPVLTGPLSYVFYVPEYYARFVAAVLAYAAANPVVLVEGLTFSVALLIILTAHEMGHYLACRHYGVSATLPFFIPAPPLFLAGTFGAFIKMKSPIPSRHALFDIGLAGPLAGFVALVPIAIAGIISLKPGLPPPSGESVIIFSDPLFIRLIAKAVGVDPTYAAINPLYMAAWIGLLVTSLNLMPVGQLDGGHGTFSLFGARAHWAIGRIAFVTMALLAVLGFVWFGSPSGLLYTVLLAVMLKVRHPSPEVMEPLGTRRKVVAVVTLIVFALSFWPFPIMLT